MSIVERLGGSGAAKIQQLSHTAKFLRMFLRTARKWGLLLHYSFSSLSKNAQAERNDKSCLHEFADCRGAVVVIKRTYKPSSLRSCTKMATMLAMTATKVM